MNRKLQHTVMALTATAAVFTVLLLAGGPPAPVAPAQPGAILALANGAAVDDDAAADAATTEAEAGGGEGVERRSHLRRTRAALALPYFSFAQGLRRFGS